jgi:CelD/BcsL family acetyltransferase involved in cellulose biosynthesis
MSTADASAHCEFQIFRGPDGLKALWPRWQELVAAMPEACFLHAPAWYGCYLDALAEAPEKIVFVGVFRNARLLAVLPLELRVRRLGPLPIRVLGTLQSNHLNLSDLVLPAEAARAVRLGELLAWLRRQRELRWDILHFNKIAAGSLLDRALRDAPPGGTSSEQFAHSDHFDTRGDYETATRNMSGSFRRNLRRLSRRAAEAGALRWESVSEPSKLPEAFDEFLRLEASGWKGEQGESSAIRCNPSLLRYYRNLLDSSGPQGRFRIMLLRLGEQPVAAQLAVQSGRTLHLLKIGSSEAHANLSPGNLALEHTLQQACADKDIDTVSLVTGPDWARIWKPDSQPVSSHVVPNSTLRGILWAQVLRARQLARQPRGTAPASAPQAA